MFVFENVIQETREIRNQKKKTSLCTLVDRRYAVICTCAPTYTVAMYIYMLECGFFNLRNQTQLELSERFMIFNVLLVTIGVAVSVAASAPSPIHLQVVCTANVRIATNAGKQQQQPPCHCKVDGNFIFMVQLFSGSCIALLPRLQCSFKHTTGAGWRVRALITSRCINRLKLKICPPQTPPPQNKNKIK